MALTLNTPAPALKRPAHRPALPAHEKREPVTIRMNAAEREKFEALGGNEWFRTALKRARLPGAAGAA